MKDSEKARVILQMAADLNQMMVRTEAKQAAWKEHALNCERIIKDEDEDREVPTRPWDIRRDT